MTASIRRRTSSADELLDSSNMEHLLGFLLAIATARTRQVFQRHLGTPFELRPVEYTLLALLLGNDSVSPKRLARTLRVPAPNVTVLIDRLAARGLVERRRSRTDGRALQVLLTAAGRSLTDRAHAASLTMEQGLLQKLSPAEQAMLRELLIKLAQDDAPPPAAAPVAPGADPASAPARRRPPPR